MSENKNCPNCGAELASDAPEELCPKCLMENAAWSQTIAGDDAASAPTLLDTTAGEQAPPRALPPVGADFGGYRIVRLLGKGGMGAVYEAEQVESGRRVALKVLSHKLDSEDARKRFIREGRLAASINHPNSVYVFGTEEIEGTPAITMEIVPGGTLQEKVTRDGPMLVPKAVDAILQIVAGLESAQEIGILHRDVKPSNCFVDDGGVAKIGDFGLSISTEGRGDSHLTMQGSLLGTPAFSSPEQLRGDELNARSDMYSVGATLFYLLTGRAPFEEGNMVKLLARVLEESPPDPRSVRPDIPKGLARIVLRCLSKTASDRFKSYDELRRALETYSSESPTPATMALRFMAYAKDSVLLGLLGWLLQIAAWGNVGDVFNVSNIGTAKWFVIVGGVSMVSVCYFTFLEGLRGATLGKRLLRLRVIGADRHMPGIPRAFGRTLILTILFGLPFWGLVIINPEALKGEQSQFYNMLIGAGSMLMWGLTFVLARRRNGFAGLHELASGTRVVRTLPSTKRPVLEVATAGEGEPGEDGRKVGPYHVLEQIGTSENGHWFLGYDTKLLRRVWVHEVTPGSDPVSATQRNLNRAGRLRWITGRRSDEESWDVYEAPMGKPLAELPASDRSWRSVRFWLLDLAEELTQAREDGTTPDTLSLENVWITADGHAKLLDFPAPGTQQRGEPFEDAGSFLRGTAEVMVGDSRPMVPLHVANFLQDGAVADPRAVRDALWQGVRRPDSISRRRRIAIGLAVSLFPVIAIAVNLFWISLLHGIRDNHPELSDLGSVTMAVKIEKDETTREHLRQYIAIRFGDLIEDPETWAMWQANMAIDPQRQRIARDAVKDYGHLGEEDIGPGEIAASIPLHEKFGMIPDLPPIAILVLVCVAWIPLAAIPSLLAAVIARRGLIFLMFGAVVVDSAGRQASRGRALWRSMIAWSPLVIAIVVAIVLEGVADQMTSLIGGMAILAVAVVATHLPRYRSLHDRLAGTWLVPK